MNGRKMEIMLIGATTFAALYLLTASIGILAYQRVICVEIMTKDLLDQIQTHRMITEYETEDIETAIEDAVEGGEVTELTSLGEFTITHYCPCEKCCGKTDGITYTGTKATAGRTIGVNPDVIPLGSKVWINGNCYIAEDTGGAIKGNHIDMFVDSHDEALAKGIYKAEVWLEV